MGATSLSGKSTAGYVFCNCIGIVLLYYIGVVFQKVAIVPLALGPYCLIISRIKVKVATSMDSS